MNEAAFDKGFERGQSGASTARSFGDAFTGMFDSDETIRDQERGWELGRLAGAIGSTENQ